MLIVFQDVTIPAAFCFAIGMYAAGSVPVLLCGTTPPRWVCRAVTAVHQVAVHAGHDLNRAIATAERHAHAAVHASREAFRDAVALLILLTTRPQGALR